MTAHQHTPAIQEHADEWHHHDPSEGRPQSEHAGVVDSGMVAKWFVGILVFVVGLVIVVGTYFVSVVSEMRAVRVETTLVAKEANAAKAQAETALGLNGGSGTYGVGDAMAGTVQTPIGDAMKKVQQRYSKGK